jgi:mannose-6-phosphate isomerase-like protein (cupin superfamily)
VLRSRRGAPGRKALGARGDLGGDRTLRGQDPGAGHRLSLQYHQKKAESIYLLRGRLRVTLENGDGELEVHDLEPGESRDVPVGRRHRFEALEDCEILEVSSPELDDVVRIEDDYEREGSAPRTRRAP